MKEKRLQPDLPTSLSTGIDTSAMIGKNIRLVSNADKIPWHKGIKGIAIQAIDALSYYCGLIGGTFLLIMGLLIFYEIFVRSIGYPTVWTFEISTTLFIWGSMLGLNYALKEKAHVNVDILTSKASQHMGRFNDRLVFLFGAAYCFILIWKGSKLAFISFMSDEKVPSILATPLWIIQSAIPVGVMLLLFQMVRIFLRIEKHEKKQQPVEWSKADIAILLLTLFIFTALTFPLFTGEIESTAVFILLALVLLALLLIGMPIFITLGLLGSYGLYMVMGAKIGLHQVPVVVFSSLDSFVLLAVPLFIMTGFVFMNSGLSKDLFNLASLWLRHLPGGLAIAAVLACAIFASICGSSTATAATIGLVSIREMRSRGYDNRIVLGTLAAGGTLGILIPPSIPMIIYGMITSQSVGKLFIAGIIPGIIILCFFSLYLYWVHKYRYKSVHTLEPATWKERFTHLKYSIWGLLGPFIILGGIYSGLFTPTEAAGVGLVYSLLIWIIVYKKFNLKSLTEIILNTVKTNSMLMIIVAGALVFGQLITLLRIPEMAVNIFLEPDGTVLMNKYFVLLLINAMLLFLGCFLEVISIMLITLPILYPIILQLGFDPIWFGIILVINMELAAITPPVGLNLYVIMGVGNDRLENIIAGVIPFIIIIAMSITLFMISPSIITFFI